MFSSSGHLTFDPYTSYKCQRLASTASKSIFGNFEVKEAVKVIEAVEVIMTDGANEAIEVTRLT